MRPEYEYVIPKTDAQEMLERFCDGRIVEKTRQTCLYEGMIWEIDQFSGASQGLVVAEIELSSRTRRFCSAMGRTEVTDDPGTSTPIW